MFSIISPGLDSALFTLYTLYITTCDQLQILQWNQMQIQAVIFQQCNVYQLRQHCIVYGLYIQILHTAYAGKAICYMQYFLMSRFHKKENCCVWIFHSNCFIWKQAHTLQLQLPQTRFKQNIHTQTHTHTHPLNPSGQTSWVWFCMLFCCTFFITQAK